MSSMRVIFEGNAVGDVLKLEEPLSFWGGVDPETSKIIDHAHPQHGETLNGRLLVMPHGRGSSGGSNVLAELIRADVAPAGFVLGASDPILLTGAIVGYQLYGQRCPMVVAPDQLDIEGRWELRGNRLARVDT